MGEFFRVQVTETPLQPKRGKKNRPKKKKILAVIFFFLIGNKHSFNRTEEMMQHKEQNVHWKKLENFTEDTKA